MVASGKERNALVSLERERSGAVLLMVVGFPASCRFVLPWTWCCAELVRADAGAGTVAGAAVEMVRRRSASLLLWLLARRGAVEVGGGRRRDGVMVM